MATTDTAARNTAIVRRFPEEVASQGRIDVIDEICAPDVIDHGPLSELQGRDELKEQAEYVTNAFSNLTVTVRDAVAEGDMVALRVTFSGTHDGEFMGVEPTGRTVDIQNMAFFRLDDGRIVERWIQPDTLKLLEQLGVVETPT